MARYLYEYVLTISDIPSLREGGSNVFERFLVMSIYIIIFTLFKLNVKKLSCDHSCKEFMSFCKSI